jgi:hypothetical protein
MMDARRMDFKLPPRFVNVPVERVYDGGVSASAALTYLRILGLHWDAKNPPRMNLKGWLKALAMGRTAFYTHLKELESSGWLSSSTDGEGVLAFEFQVESANPDERPEKRTDASSNTDSDSQEIPLEEAAVRNPGFRTRKEQEEKPADPRLDHPAVKLYRQVMHLTASEHQRQMIVDAVKDVALWEDTLDHWVEHGWNPTSLPGMLDSYRRGGRLACASCRRIARDDKPPSESPGESEKPTPEQLRAMIAQARRRQGEGDEPAGAGEREGPRDDD